MFNISSSKPMSSISETLFAPQGSQNLNLLKLLPNIIKAVSFHFQTSVYGIKCNITKKNCAVDLKERHKLCELLRRVEAS